MLQHVCMYRMCVELCVDMSVRNILGACEISFNILQITLPYLTYVIFIVVNLIFHHVVKITVI